MTNNHDNHYAKNGNVLLKQYFGLNHPIYLYVIRRLFYWWKMLIIFWTKPSINMGIWYTHSYGSLPQSKMLYVKPFNRVTIFIMMAVVIS